MMIKTLTLRSSGIVVVVFFAVCASVWCVVGIAIGTLIYNGLGVISELRLAA